MSSIGISLAIGMSLAIGISGFLSIIHPRVVGAKPLRPCRVCSAPRDIRLLFRLPALQLNTTIRATGKKPNWGKTPTLVACPLG